MASRNTCIDVDTDNEMEQDRPTPLAVYPLRFQTVDMMAPFTLTTFDEAAAIAFADIVQSPMGETYTLRQVFRALIGGSLRAPSASGVALLRSFVPPRAAQMLEGARFSPHNLIETMVWSVHAHLAAHTTSLDGIGLYPFMFTDGIGLYPFMFTDVHLQLYMTVEQAFEFDILWSQHDPDMLHNDTFYTHFSRLRYATLQSIALMNNVPILSSRSHSLSKPALLVALALRLAAAGTDADTAVPV
jgi:hypothetical protein